MRSAIDDVCEWCETLGFQLSVWAHHEFNLNELCCLSLWIPSNVEVVGIWINELIRL